MGAKGLSAFWYLCYHTLFWLDLYPTAAEEGFTPPEPLDLVEMQPHETLPRVYTRLELLLYTLRHVQEHAAQLHMFLGQQVIKGDTLSSTKPTSIYVLYFHFAGGMYNTQQDTEFIFCE